MFAWLRTDDGPVSDGFATESVSVFRGNPSLDGDLDGMTRTCSLSARRNLWFRSVCVTNLSALLCKRTRRRFGNGHVSKRVPGTPRRNADSLSLSESRRVIFCRRDGLGPRPGVTSTDMAC